MLNILFFSHGGKMPYVNWSNIHSQTPTCTKHIAKKSLQSSWRTHWFLSEWRRGYKLQYHEALEDVSPLVWRLSGRWDDSMLWELPQLVPHCVPQLIQNSRAQGDDQSCKPFSLWSSNISKETELLFPFSWATKEFITKMHHHLDTPLDFSCHILSCDSLTYIRVPWGSEECQASLQFLSELNKVEQRHFHLYQFHLI